MRYSQSEKMEIIRLVEESELPIKRTLDELDVSKSTFYRWYRRYNEHGYDGLASRPPNANRFWNRIPEHEKEKVVEVALESFIGWTRTPPGRSWWPGPTAPIRR